MKELIKIFEKKRNGLIKIAIIVSLFLLGLNYYGSSKRSSYYGWVKITDKYIKDSSYHITADLGEEKIKIAGKTTETFIYENPEYDSHEVLISQVWDVLEEEEKVFMKISSNILKSTYEIEKLYGY